MKRDWIVAVCLVLAGVCLSTPVQACLELPANPPDVTVSGDACAPPFLLTVTLHDYSTFAASADFCGCALNLPLTFGTVVGASVVESATGATVGAFQFSPDNDTTFGSGSTAWQGFSGFVNSVVGSLAVDLVFLVEPSQEIPCNIAADQLADALSNPPGGVVVGTGGTDPEGVPNHHIGISPAGTVTISEPGRLCGSKYLDSNLNGKRDPGEPGLGGWEILITDAAGNTQVVTTDSEGNYCVELEAGPYSVQEVAQTGWLQTAPPGGAHQVVLQPGGELFGVDFGNGCCKEGPQPDLELSLNTGFDQSTSTLIPAGLLDDNWVVVLDDGGGPVPRMANVVNDGPLPAPLAGSMWITAVPNAAGTGFGWPVAPPSSYEYQYCFCLANGFSEPTLELDILADDTVEMIDLNGVPLFVGPGGNFGDPPLHVSSDPDSFRPGQNCLTVRVQDNFQVATGFTLTGSVTARGGFCCAEGQKSVRVRDLPKRP